MPHNKKDNTKKKVAKMELTLSWFWYHGIFYILWVFMAYYVVKTVIWVKNSPWFSSKDEYIQISNAPPTAQAQAEDDLDAQKED